MTLTTSAPAFSTLVLIDSAVENYESLVAGIHPNAEVIVLDATQDGVEQITAALGNRTHLTALHILSHGRSGEIQIGTTYLNAQTLGSYAPQIQRWANAFSANAEILLYGCKVAAGEVGQRFVQQIGQLTGAAIAASTELVGNARLNGAWNLAFATGFQPALAFRPDALEAYPGVLAVLLNETFRGADVTTTPWRFGIGAGTTSANPFLTARQTAAPSSANGLPGAGTVIDAPGSGALRLTGAANEQASFVIYNRPISQAEGLTITFDLFAYGGTPAEGRNGDGFSFFLLNGSANPVNAGAFGGSLGYAQKNATGIPGIAGGYLGVGYDEFGNFSTSVETPLLQRPTPAGVATPVPDSIAVRGSEASQYAFLGGTGTLAQGVDVPAATRREDAQRRARIDLSPTGLLTVRTDLNLDGDFEDSGEIVLNNLDVRLTNGALPANFKFGFAASTGNATNIHEVRNLIVRTFVRPELPAPPVVGPDEEGGGGGDGDGTGEDCLPGRRLRGNSQPNTLRGGGNSNRMIGFAGADVLQGRGCDDEIDGGLGNDRMFGNADADILRGQQGNDRGLGGRGRDRLLGGLGNDALDGGNNVDNLEGGRGRDRLLGGQGADTLDGGRGEDRLLGEVGNDRLLGRQESDILNGGGGGDTLSGGLGIDRLVGGRGQDTLSGNRGGDSIFGSGGGDTLIGGEGNDLLVGGTQGDEMFGDQGNDILEGGGGRDRLRGGAGSDRFVYSSVKDRGDRIIGFQARSASFDQIDLRRVFSQPGFSQTNRFERYVRLVQSNRNTVVRVDFNGDASGGFQALTTLNSTVASSLRANNFLT